MPKKIPLEWEGRVLALSSLMYSSRQIRKILLKEKIDLSQTAIVNIVNCVGNRRTARSQGMKSSIKRQPLKQSTRVALKKIDLLTRKKNPPSQRQMAKLVQVPRSTVQQIIKRLGKRVAFKTTVHSLNPKQIANRKTNSKKIYEKYLAGQKSEFVVSLDEAMFYVQNCNGKRRVCYVKRGEKIPENWVVQKGNFLKKHMVVGAISGRGVIDLFQVPKKVKVNADWYISKVLKPLVNTHLPRIYGDDLHKVVIHHDKASSHTSY